MTAHVFGVQDPLFSADTWCNRSGMGLSGDVLNDHRVTFLLLPCVFVSV